MVGDVALASIVKLLIIDEVHLLHSDRGPVVEAIVARTLRQVCQNIFSTLSYCYKSVAIRCQSQPISKHCLENFVVLLKYFIKW